LIPSMQRDITVEQVRGRCTDLPPARRRDLGRDVSEPRDAATLVAITDVGTRAAVVVTRRPSTMTYHRGAWASLVAAWIRPWTARSPTRQGARQARSSASLKPTWRFSGGWTAT